MHTSARNAFYGRVGMIRHSTVFSEISFTAQNDCELVAVITHDSFQSMALHEGSPITALIKAPEVLITKIDDAVCPVARNGFPGRVTGVRDDGVAAEVMGELEGGTPMCALVTSESAKRLDLRENDQVLFFFKAFNVILSAE